jgi:hypothetical protein
MGGKECGIRELFSAYARRSAHEGLGIKNFRALSYNYCHRDNLGCVVERSIFTFLLAVQESSQIAREREIDWV